MELPLFNCCNFKLSLSRLWDYRLIFRVWLTQPDCIWRTIMLVSILDSASYGISEIDQFHWWCVLDRTKTSGIPVQLAVWNSQFKRKWWQVKKNTSNRVQTWDLRSIANFQPREPEVEAVSIFLYVEEPTNSHFTFFSSVSLFCTLFFSFLCTACL